MNDEAKPPTITLGDAVLADAREVARWYAIDLADTMTGEIATRDMLGMLDELAAACRLVHRLESWPGEGLTVEQGRVLHKGAWEMVEASEGAVEGNRLGGVVSVKPRDVLHDLYHAERATLARRVLDFLSPISWGDDDEEATA